MKALQVIRFFADDIPLPELIALQQRLCGDSSKPVTIYPTYFCGGILLLQNNQPVATTCLYHNPAIDAGKTLLFGNCEWVDNFDAFEELMQEINSYANSNGFTAITGPINGSTWNEYRLPVSHFGKQFCTDLPQPEYYCQHLLRSGFGVAHQYFSFLSPISPKTASASLWQQVEKAGITTRPIDLDIYDTELEKLFPFCNHAFSHNALFSPISREEFLWKYQQLKPLLNADYIWLAEDAYGTLQAFILCLPDTVQKDRLVMKTIARNIGNRQSAGLVRLLADGIYNRAYSAGFRHMIHAFMHSGNRSKVLSEKYSGQVLKEYDLFTKKTDPWNVKPTS